MARKSNILAAIDRVARSESAFLRQEFLAPAVRGAGVTVRVDGVRLRLAVRPHGFEGWAVFRPRSHSDCGVVRPASAVERRRYLNLFPAVRLILCHREGDTLLALPAADADGRFGDGGPIPVRLTDDDVELFDTVVARFDGRRVWYDDLDARTDPGAAGYMRACLTRMLAPDKVDRPGLTAGQCAAYRAVHRYRVALARADARANAADLLRESLAHAGAALREFSEQRDGRYRVTYDVDGRRHTSIVKADLTVESAGICLSGEDRRFDLASLVGVLREGRDAGRL